MIVLKKHLTRDAQFIVIECWYEGKGESFEKFFGFKKSPTAYLFNKSAFEFYTNRDDFNEKLPRQLAIWIRDNPKKIPEINEIVVNGLDFFRKSIESHYESAEGILKDIKRITEHLKDGYKSVLIEHHLPIFHGNFLEKGERLYEENVVKQIVSWRKNTGNIFFNTGISSVGHLLKRISEMKGWEEGLLEHIRLNELQKAMRNENPFPKEELKKRKSVPYLYFNFEVIYEHDIDARMEESGFRLDRNMIAGNSNEVKGMVANLGKARGTVRIIRSRDELGKFKEGDVLVAPMTFVWHEPVLKKAVAIVTDEGGITCHAAILSREFNKPCVIGTKNATSVFMDGDFVEVDAEKGIVRKAAQHHRR